MNETIIGSFFFRIEKGNLVGLYTNLTINQPLRENANRIMNDENASENLNGFIGNFNSRWEELNQETDSSILSIGQLPGSENKFTLIWHQHGRIYFRGEGFLTQDGNLLVGHYTN